ncbi:MAG TPA: CAP domain-containing protein [Kineosporiaceae bacterium]|nr:CAP domain-containing protein [Kineosporiaceae bacterium]
MPGRRGGAADPLLRALLVLALVLGGATLALGSGLVPAGRSALPPAGRAAAPPEVTAEPGRGGPTHDVQVTRPAPRPPGAGARLDGGLPLPTAAPVSSAPEEAVVTLTNRQRLAAGCPRLRWDDTLARAANVHARDLVVRNYFEHVSPDGRSPLDRARALGFEGGVGENLAVGYASAPDVVTGWMESPGHRANILDCRFSLIGVAYLDAVIPDRNARGVWVQEFGTLAS